MLPYTDSSLLRELDDILLDIEAQRAHQMYRAPGEGVIPWAKTICILGGGTAGFLAAIAIKRAFGKEVQVTLLEAPDVPIIGVGEATVDTLPPFLHDGLGIDIVDFYDQVRPTWKLGIRFEWGPLVPNHFAAPFGWGSRGLGLIPSLMNGHSTNLMNLAALLMSSDRVPLFKTTDGYRLAAHRIRYGYHLDNARFVAFLRRYAVSLGVEHQPVRVSGATLVRAPSGEHSVSAVTTGDGASIKADLFVDCSGFRSFLLRQRVGGAFHSYASSLFTDRALVFKVPNAGHLKPYTSAITMDSGWCWNIPCDDGDHCGYVYSSAHVSDDDARAEVVGRFKSAAIERLVHFQSGRSDRCWIGNVFAIGNSYGFVEPLESTGILMIQTHIEHLLTGLRSNSVHAVRERINQSVAQRWDGLRWFLALHFRFNGRRNTPYWRTARQTTDVSGMAAVLGLFAAGAPLALRNPRDLQHIEGGVPFFYGIAGLDCILLGQRVPTTVLPALQSRAEWQNRVASARRLTAAAIPHGTALSLLHRHPQLLREHAEHDLRYLL